MFDKVYSKILENKELKESGKQLSITPPFPRFAEKFPGFEKSRYYIFTANSGVGKTKFTKFFAITSVYNFIRLNPDYKARIFYFALEETSTEFWLSFISTMLYEKYNIELSTANLKSLGSYTVNDFILNKIKECEEFVNELSKFVEVIDYIHNPFGIYKYVRDYFESSKEIGEYIYEFINEGKTKIVSGYKHNTDTHYFTIVDHLGILTSENQMNEHQTIGNYSKEYALKGFVKRFGISHIDVQQQVSIQEKQEFYKGETIDQKLEPSLDGLGNNKETQRQADFILGIFAPARYGIAQYRGYDITKLQDHYRALKVLKDRNYGLANSYIHCYFNGAANAFSELPPAEEFKKNPKLYENYKN